MNRRILSTFLLATLPLGAEASNIHLRGNAQDQHSNQALREERRLLDGNQLQFDVEGSLIVDYEAAGYPNRLGSGDEFVALIQAHDRWIMTTIELIDNAHDFFDIDNCHSDFMGSGWDNAPNGMAKHTATFRYTCTFQELITPNGASFVSAVATVKNDNDFLINYVQTLPAIDDNANLYSFASSWLSTVTYINPTGDLNRNVFDNQYVLPFGIAWDFDTPVQQSTEQDYYAVGNATKQWLDENWEQFYGATNEPRFERQTTRVRFLSGGYYSYHSVYTQSISFEVNLLIAANRIENVPSVKSYTTTMRYFYRISQFLDLLKPRLADDSVLQQITQATYAITPTYQVTSLVNATTRENTRSNATVSPADIPEIPAIGVVYFNLPGLS